MGTDMPQEQIPLEQKYPLVARKPREKGIAIIVATILMMFTVGIVGLAIDGGVAYFVKGRLMAAVDSAALGAGRGLNLGDTLDQAQFEATNSAKRFFAANFPNGFMGTNPALTKITPKFEMIMKDGQPTGVLQVEVTGEVVAPTYFMKIFSKDNMKIAASGTATRRTLVMMLILDISGSMGARTGVGTIPASVNSSTVSCNAMVYAASRFLKYFSPYDYVGIATFSSSARIDYPPSTNFKNAGASGADHVLANLTCNGWTNTAPSLNISWDAIRGVGLKLAMNSIILFTDGMPNQVTGNFPIRYERDTRYGQGPTYAVNSPPTNTNMLYRDLRDPYTWCTDASNNPVVCPQIVKDTTAMYNTSDIPAHLRGYTPAQRATMQATGNFTPRYGDPAFMPLTTQQFNGYSALNSTARGLYGFVLTNATTLRPRWLQDNNAPQFNFDYCRDGNTNINTLDRGITWMCYMLPLPSATVGASTVFGTISQNQGYHARFGNKANQLTPPVVGQSVGSFPSGFPNQSNGNRMVAQSIAYIPDEDAMGNSNRGPRDNWVYNVNQWCAPVGTPLPNGATDRCRFRGGTWDGYLSAGLGTNFFTDGPYKDFLRPDVPNTYVAAAMNSSISAADRIRSDTEYNIRIDSIYLIGNEPNVDREFLQYIANVETIQPTVFDAGTVMPYANTLYNPNQQKGLWFATTDPSALSSLFAQIASSLLRISR
jgi:Flp pilus assembly protein TadG